MDILCAEGGDNHICGKEDTSDKTLAEDNVNTNCEQASLKMEDGSKHNEYAYLDRSGFSSEKFKIEIRGLPKFYGIGELKKLLNEKLKLGSNKVKPPKNRSQWLYVCFRSEEDRQNAIKALNGFVWKNKTLSAEEARPAPDPLVKRRKLEDNRDHDDEITIKDAIPVEKQSVEDRLKNTTTPYWNIPYDDQVLKKQDDVKNILLKLSKHMLAENPYLSSWIKTQRSKFNGLPCELLNIRKSPLLEGYRNKCEFTIGLNEESGEKTVGFRLCSYVQGFTGVGPVDSLIHIPNEMKKAAKVFEKFIRKSELDVFSPETHEGVWRQLTVRFSSTSAQIMLIIGLHPQSLSEEQLEKLKNDIKLFFVADEGKECNVTSLYLQHIMKKEAGKNLPSPEHLLGEEYIYEYLHGLKFRISPQAFFQVNTAAAEVLYDSVKELAALNEDTTLIDVCCGTGTIGLCMSKYFDQILGLESLSEAVDDAKANAKLNNLENCDFFLGKAEDIILPVIGRSMKTNLLAVVDPPRAGLHQKAVLQLRRSDRLKRLIFLSCDPKGAFKNFIDLSRPASKTLHGSPFVPIKAVLVDMFPHTPHCELIMYFERFSMEEK